MSRPLIGICTRLDVGADLFYLRKHYSEAIYSAGGAPVLLPLIPDRYYVQRVVKKLDGIVLSGSNSDVDPQKYGAEPHPCLGPVMSRRDELDLALLEEVFKVQKPLLGICYGIQIVNVFLGGSLWQDIKSQVSGAIKHSQESTEEYKSHSVKVATGSLLHSLANEQDLRVNSFHHQAIKELAPDLNAVAVAPDGIIEAIELKEKSPFMLAVQWHPEIGWDTDLLSQKMFSRFVDAAGKSDK